MNLSPVVLFVYNRPWHTKQTIEALQKNDLALDSKLFIYSDAAKSVGAVEEVNEVRKYIKSVTGFKEVTIIERAENYGLASSVIEGVSHVLGLHEKVIVLEDDCVTSPFFLEFMNTSLRMYEKNREVMSISAYSYPITIPKNYKYDVFFYYRSSSWGWGTWRQEWQQMNWSTDALCSVDKNILKLGGEDLCIMSQDQVAGRINSWAIRWATGHAFRKAVSLYPNKTLVNNIGFGYLGTHTKCAQDAERFFSGMSLSLPERYPTDIAVNREIKKQLKTLFSVPWVYKLKYMIKNIK
jgi:hypothetical protein